MTILNFSLLIFIFVYLYNINIINRITLADIIFVSYSFICILSLYFIKDLYYFYLIYKLLNISIYIYLIQLSNDPKNFRFLTYYYFIRFMGSLIFILSLCDTSSNTLSYILLNFSLLIKLGVYPFSSIINSVYKNLSFKAYIILSYYVNYSYIIVLFYINSLFNCYPYSSSIFIIFMSVVTLINCYINFNKQYELKGAVAYSSITNLPIIICSLMPISYICADFSFEDCSLLITFVSFYIIIYGNNSLLINISSYMLEPTKGKK